MGALLERAVRRTQRMSIHQALLQLSPVETRLLVLFWHLAERWGHVTPDGISVRLRLSHELLGQLVGCRRASVTTALRHIDESGLLVRSADGTWLLRGSPPDELAEIHWQQRAAVDAVAAGAVLGVVPVAVVFRCEFCGCRPGPETQANLERQLLDLRHGEYVDAEPERWLVWHGRGIYGPTATRAATTAAS